MFSGEKERDLETEKSSEVKEGKGGEREESGNSGPRPVPPWEESFLPGEESFFPREEFPPLGRIILHYLQSKGGKFDVLLT